MPKIDSWCEFDVFDANHGRHGQVKMEPVAARGDHHRAWQWHELSLKALERFAAAIARVDVYDQQTASCGHRDVCRRPAVEPFQDPGGVGAGISNTLASARVFAGALKAVTSLPTGAYAIDDRMARENSPREFGSVKQRVKLRCFS